MVWYTDCWTGTQEICVQSFLGHGNSLGGLAIANYLLKISAVLKNHLVSIRRKLIVWNSYSII